jgi:hypothetical protein
MIEKSKGGFAAMLPIKLFILSLPSRLLIRAALFLGGYKRYAEHVVFIQTRPSTIRRWVKLNEHDGKIEDRGESPELDDFRNSPTGKLIPHDFSWPGQNCTHEYTVRQYSNSWEWSLVTYGIRETTKQLDDYFNDYKTPAQSVMPLSDHEAVA